LDTAGFDAVRVGEAIEGQAFPVTRDTIRAFAEASLDFNPLHLDDTYMEGSFGKTHFGGVIMHGMTNFALMTKTLTDWLLPRGGMHRRLETRWLRPVKPGDTITPRAQVVHTKTTEQSRWVSLEVTMTNQRGETVATGEALAEFPDWMKG
jgi:3-hydroxybutyryl-CoA dehydratase